jgi:curved DNA-binding protein CbpA
LNLKGTLSLRSGCGRGLYFSLNGEIASPKVYTRVQLLSINNNFRQSSCHSCFRINPSILRVRRSLGDTPNLRYNLLTTAMARSPSDSDPEVEDLDDAPFDVNDINPYSILELERTADQKQIRKAYYAAAVKHHPDKVAHSEKATATEHFQKVQFAYTILSDEQRKARYDRTGSTKEAAELDDEDFSWKDFFDGLTQKIDGDAIRRFKKEYRKSDEEKADLLAAYTRFEGRMDDVYEHIMLSNPLDDDKRFHKIIDEAIEAEEVPSRYQKETRQDSRQRSKRSRRLCKRAQAPR